MKTLFFFLSFYLSLLCSPYFHLYSHHFKGLPHYNYFENYPQTPEEEYLGQSGNFEFSLVVYDFQGINKEKVERPDDVRLFLVIYNMKENSLYKSSVTLNLLDNKKSIFSQHFPKAGLENIYSIQKKLPPTGQYSLQITINTTPPTKETIRFKLSSQKVHWGKWIGLIILFLIVIAAIGSRKARITMDKKNHLKQKKREENKCQTQP